MYNKLIKTPLFAEVLALLDKTLSPTLRYHTVDHTRDVIQEAITLGMLDKLAPRDLELLGCAALFHDSGFIEGHLDHEGRGAELAARMLSATGEYSPEEIELVSSMIRDTRILPEPTIPCQHASSPLARYLLDADVANFGRADFWEKSNQAREEAGGKEREFLQQTVALLNRHRWLTTAGEQRFGAMKTQNLQLLLDKISSLI